MSNRTYANSPVLCCRHFGQEPFVRRISLTCMLLGERCRVGGKKCIRGAI